MLCLQRHVHQTVFSEACIMFCLKMHWHHILFAEARIGVLF